MHSSQNTSSQRPKHQFIHFPKQTESQLRMTMPSKSQSRQNETNKAHDDEQYFPICPAVLNPEVMTDFRVYLKQNDRFVLYTLERQRFTQKLKDRLVNNGIETVYVPSHQQESYEQYVFENLDTILTNSEIDEEVRSRVLLDTSAKQMENIFENQENAITQETIQDLGKLVDSSMKFLSRINAIESLAKFVSHDYKTYTHCVNVFAYSSLMLNTYNLPFSFKRKVGMGALLHDIGKTLIPQKILNKPGKLNPQEWIEVQKHSIYGVRVCSHLTLSQTTIHCILFHHEKYNGRGYLSGLSGDEIPFPVKIITCCDVYDAITSKRPYADAETSLNTLKIMSQEMEGSFDQEIFQRFASLVSPT
ncbi:MAG: HD-GYP domain-containing protein [Thermodesulfobacteriota bacterium]